MLKSRPMAKLNLTRWLRFSLRTLLVAITLLCVWLGLVWVPAQRANWATKELQRLGFDVQFDYQHIPGTSKHNHSPVVPQPGWQFLKSLLGDGLFQHADWIGRTHKSLKTDDVKLIERIPSLRLLQLDGCQIGDEQMPYIANLRRLDFL